MDVEGDRILKIQVRNKLPEVHGKYDITRKINADKFDNEIERIEKDYANEIDKVTKDYDIQIGARKENGLLNDTADLEKEVSRIVGELVKERDEAISDTEKKRDTYQLDNQDINHRAELQKMSYKSGKGDMETYIEIWVPDSLIDDLRIIVAKGLLNSYKMNLDVRQTKLL